MKGSLPVLVPQDLPVSHRIDDEFCNGVGFRV